MIVSLQLLGIEVTSSQGGTVRVLLRVLRVLKIHRVLRILRVLRVIRVLKILVDSGLLGLLGYKPSPRPSSAPPVTHN